VKFDRKANTLTIRILNDSNKHEEVKVTDKLKIDGVSYRNYDQMLDMLAGNNAPTKYDIGDDGFADMHCYPIRYRYRQDGTLMEIDTPRRAASEDADTLQWMGVSSSLGTKRGFMFNYVLGFETPVRPDTPFFTVSASEEVDTNDGWQYKWTDEAFNNTTYTSVVEAVDISKNTSRNYNYYGYKCNSESEIADMILCISGPGGASNDSSLFMFDRAVNAYDEDSEESVIQLIGYLFGVKTVITVMPEYSVSSNITGLQQGDVIQYGTDSLGRLSRLRKIISHVGPDTLTLQTVADGNENDNFSRIRTGDQRKLASAMIFGYVLKRRNDLVLIKGINWGTNVPINKATATVSVNPPATDEVWIRIPASTPVVVYDPSKTDPVYAGTYDEILDGPDMSVIGIRYGSGTTIREIVVLNE